MPRQSIRKNLLNAVDQAALALARMQAQDILDDWSDLESETDSEDLDSDLDLLSTSNDDDTSNLLVSSPSPPSPLSPLSPMTGIISDSSSGESNNVAVPYDRLQDTITALHDEVKRVHVLHKPDEPPPRAPQLHMLVHVTILSGQIINPLENLFRGDDSSLSSGILQTNSSQQLIPKFGDTNTSVNVDGSSDTHIPVSSTQRSKLPFSQFLDCVMCEIPADMSNPTQVNSSMNVTAIGKSKELVAGKQTRAMAK
ncbi:hypothetical protein EDD22DRAFT_960999 [Suillus occidentalis]|nr:hypothetical protein EDD22DRAFT_960999 [Suillus occidentalis]